MSSIIIYSVSEMQGMPPPYSSGPPAGAVYGYPGYAPAPPVFPQQQQSNNTVSGLHDPTVTKLIANNVFFNDDKKCALYVDYVQPLTRTCMIAYNFS